MAAALPRGVLVIAAALAAAAASAAGGPAEGAVAASRSLRGSPPERADGVQKQGNDTNLTAADVVESGVLQMEGSGTNLTTADMADAEGMEEVVVSNISAEGEEIGRPVLYAGTPAAPGAQCLCLFDVDRTLTGKQGFAAKCPGDQAVAGVYDNAYGGGTFTTSQLAPFIPLTPCGACQRAILSAGTGGSPAARARLLTLIGGGNMVFGCAGKMKPTCAKALALSAGVPLASVFMFDDMPANVLAFAGSGINAHVVSCVSRDGDKGLCGATVAEIQLKKGVTACR